MKKLFIAALLICPLAMGQTQQTTGTAAAQANATQKNDDSKKDASKKKDKDEITAATVARKGAWEWGGFFEGGTGVGKRSTTQFVFFGARGGRVLTAEHLPGFLKGTFEWAVDIIPMYYTKQPTAGTNTLGFSFNPAVWKWNFTSNKRVIPYAEIAGGVLVTGKDVPTGTNNVNFTPQGGFGIDFLRDKKKQAFTANIKYQHISNAGIANSNSGINASVIFGVGYTWWR